MDISEILDGLNDAQRKAVSAPVGKSLVLAGAGSGKTRVLVHRISWLIKVEGVSPYDILAVTFTNKAAKEMQGRVEEMIQAPVRNMWIGTFHGIAHRLLRMHWEQAKLPQQFQILDADDQLRLIKRLMKSMQIDDSRYPPRQAMWYINSKKDEGIRAKYILSVGDNTERKFLDIYHAYEEACNRSGLVDFAELLLRAHELLRDNLDLLSHYQRRFSHILVDEFQDTNTIQYAWVKLLTAEHTELFLVGDDDQSIYGWRGAKIENIQRISDDFPNVAIHRLEQNYRSTSTILNAANSIIVNNPDRLGKKLWTAGEQGDPISLYCAYNEIDEARYVIERIAKYVEEDVQRSEIAILYRSNAQSRVFEEALINRGIPYRVYGGLRFFERAEIKDSLAYLRLIANRHDDASFERVINTPTRGIGDRSVETIREHARQNNSSMWAAAHDIVENNLMAARAKNAIAGFIALINEIALSAGDIKLHELVAVMLDKVALRSHFEKDKTDKGQAKVENINELINAARGFEQETDAEQQEHLQMFLTNAALEAGEGQGSEWEDCVQLMTLHSAKGLEFENVFIVGMEQGLFPSQMAVGRQQGLDEERRLCYVGITRARKLLHMSYAESRRIYGKETFCTRSRFLDEISPELIEEVRPTANPYQLASTSSLSGFSANPVTNRGESKYSLGQGVSHAKFGDGVVINTEGNGSNQMVQVMFASCGEKWLLADKANLVSI